MIEVRYAGAVVGRSAIVRGLDTQGLFLGTTEPMPVGTLVTLKVGEHTVQGKVAGVSESQELARAGMRVRFADPASASLFGTPGEAPADPEPPLEAIPVKASGPVAVSQPVPQELSAGAAAAASGSVITSAPRRIVVDASTESAAVAAPVAAEEVEASVPVAGAPAEPAAPGEGGGKKNRRNKRR